MHDHRTEQSRRARYGGAFAPWTDTTPTNPDVATASSRQFARYPANCAAKSARAVPHNVARSGLSARCRSAGRGHPVSADRSLQAVSEGGTPTGRGVSHLTRRPDLFVRCLSRRRSADRSRVRWTFLNRAVSSTGRYGTVHPRRWRLLPCVCGIRIGRVEHR